MFEASLLPQRNGKDARLVRWIASGSLALQAATVAMFIVVPLIYPAKLPALSTAPKMTSLTLPKPPVRVIPPKPVPVPVTNHAAVSAPSPQTVAAATAATRLGSLSHTSAAPVTDAAPLLAVGGGTMSSGPVTLGAVGDPLGMPAVAWW